MESTFVTIVLTVLIFAVLIFIHEFGHFIVAKCFHIRVQEFSIGMGPKLLQSDKHETTITLRAFPIGGYVSLEGEDEESADPRAFCNQKAWKRFCVLAAGAVMNLLLGFLILFAITLPQETLATNTIAAFREDAVTNSEGLQVNDEILSINGHRVFTTMDIMSYLLNDSSTPDRTIVVLRDGERVRLEDVTFQTTESEDGIKSLYIDFYVYSENNSMPRSLSYALRSSITYGRLIWDSFVDLVTGKIAFTELSGPVGVGTAVSEAVSYGMESLLLLCVFLTINLGIFNLLPIPALDGGRLLFVVIEMVIRRPVNRKYEAYVHAAGMILLMLLMVFITAKDLFQLF
jgi:regulator of sigma E protease